MRPRTLVPKQCANLILFCAAVFGQNSAQVQGTVIDDGGQPLASASVALRRFPAFAKSSGRNARTAPQRVPGDPDVNLTAAAGVHGSFAFSDLPSGRYLLCASSASGGYLPTCDWSRPVTFTIAPGETRTGIQIRMARGATVRIRVNDPGAHLSSGETAANTHLIVAVGTSSGEFHAAIVAAKDASGRDYSINVPFGISLFAWIASRDLLVTDEAGHDLQRLGSATYFTIPVNGAGRTFAFNIKGRAK